jgi:hypothetical protein
VAVKSIQYVNINVRHQDDDLHFVFHLTMGGPGGSMSYVVGSNNSYNPITNTAWVRARLCKLQKGCTRLAAASDKAYQLLAHGRWFSPGTPASSTTKIGRHDIAEILLKVALKHQKSNQIKNHLTMRTAANYIRGCRGCDRMVVGFRTTYAISAYHH